MTFQGLSGAKCDLDADFNTRNEPCHYLDLRAVRLSNLQTRMHSHRDVAISFSLPLAPYIVIRTATDGFCETLLVRRLNLAFAVRLMMYRFHKG